MSAENKAALSTKDPAHMKPSYFRTMKHSFFMQKYMPFFKTEGCFMILQAFSTERYCRIALSRGFMELLMFI